MKRFYCILVALVILAGSAGSFAYATTCDGTATTTPAEDCLTLAVVDQTATINLWAGVVVFFLVIILFVLLVP